MDSLPLDITLNIFSRLPFVSFIHCNRVSKSWHALLKHPQLQQAFLESQNNLCLIHHCSSSCSPQDQIFLVNNCSHLSNDDDHWKDIMKINIPLKNHKFSSVSNCKGFLFLSYNESNNKLVVYNKICVYNIYTAELTHLPGSHLVIKGFKVAYGFGFHPRTKEYKVVRIVEQECVRYYFGQYELSLDQSIEVFTLGTYAWRTKRSNPFLLRMQPSEALINGALHWLGQAKVRHSQIILSFDLEDERFYQIPSPNCRFDVLDWHLLVLGGCLSLAVYNHNKKNKIDIWLMKNYDMKESWTKEFTINSGSLSLGSIRPLCLLKNGKVLFEYAKQSLFLYDTNKKTTKKINLGDFPYYFQAVPMSKLSIQQGLSSVCTLETFGRDWFL
uniref:F-box domain-containing protein n=1 Tax=Fagus sylvatica TaxID=28930 RepID=A0A2N9HY55_FAGSY